METIVKNFKMWRLRSLEPGLSTGMESSLTLHQTRQCQVDRHKQKAHPYLVHDWELSLGGQHFVHEFIDALGKNPKLRGDFLANYNLALNYASRF